MKLERENAILAMQSMGWTAKQEKRGKTQTWKFSRPDTAGLWDVTSVRQDNLGLRWVCSVAMSYGDASELISEIIEAENRWVKKRFPALMEGE